MVRHDRRFIHLAADCGTRARDASASPSSTTCSRRGGRTGTSPLSFGRHRSGRLRGRSSLRGGGSGGLRLLRQHQKQKRCDHRFRYLGRA